MTFGSESPKYFEKGLVPLPIKSGTKRPVESGWAKAEKYPTSDPEKGRWISQHKNQNVGLLMGTSIDDDHIIVAVDVDDDRLVKVTRAIIGEPLVSKRAKKGETVFVRSPINQSIKSTQFKGQGDLNQIDILAKSRCTVVPPSIHPETKRPYVWLSETLLECDLNKLPLFDMRKFNILKAVTTSDHTPAILGGKATNEPTLRLVAQLVSAGASDEEVGDIIGALLPDDYSGNSLSELRAMIAGARKKGFDEEEATSEKKQSEVALSLLENEIHLFNTELGEAFAEIKTPKGARVSDKINSSTIGDFIEYKFFLAMRKPISPQGMSEVKNTLNAKAKFLGPTETVSVRKAYHQDCIYIDLGRSDGQIVKISAKGWEITTKSPVRFRRPQGMGILPLPQRGGSSTAMYDLFGLKGPNAVLRLAFELTALSPDGPYFILMTQGSQGSGKTKQNESIKNTLDPSAAPKLRLPRSERDLAVQARDAFVLSYDNASNLRWEMSDVLCTVATGGGLVTRELYTDDGAKIFTFKRPLMMNGIGEYADRPDLLERSLQLDLARMPTGQRKSERVLDREFEKLLPQHLGFLYDCVAHALANLDETPEIDTIRMSDAAQWLVASEPATRLPDGTFLYVIESAQNKMMLDRIENNIICIELLKILQKQDRFEGTVGDLHAKLIHDTGRVPPGMPKTPSNLSKALSRLEPMLEVTVCTLSNTSETGPFPSHRFLLVRLCRVIDCN